MSKLVPKYLMWEAINVALVGLQRALEEIRTLARMPGPAGKDGKDGLSFKDFAFDVEFDGERTFTLKWSNGEKTETRSFVTRMVLDQGVYREGQPYVRGDGVSYGGQFWIARQDTTEKPEMNGGPWRLSVKKGRDGKDGVLKEPPPRGPVKVG